MLPPIAAPVLTPPELSAGGGVVGDAVPDGVEEDAGVPSGVIDEDAVFVAVIELVLVSAAVEEGEAELVALGVLVGVGGAVTKTGYRVVGAITGAAGLQMEKSPS